MKLTGKQELFCQEYIVDLNATQAAIRAGYSENTAQEIGSENLSKPIISDRIAELQQERIERTQVKADDVVKELARLGFMRPERYFKLNADGEPFIACDELDEDSWAAIKGVTNKTKYFTDKDGQTTETKEVKLDLADKKSALDSLGRHLGMYVDRSEVKLMNPEIVDKMFMGFGEVMTEQGWMLNAKGEPDEDARKELFERVALVADGVK